MTPASICNYTSDKKDYCLLQFYYQTMTMITSNNKLASKQAETVNVILMFTFNYKT